MHRAQQSGRKNRSLSALPEHGSPELLRCSSRFATQWRSSIQASHGFLLFVSQRFFYAETDKGKAPFERLNSKTGCGLGRRLSQNLESKRLRKLHRHFGRATLT